MDKILILANFHMGLYKFRKELIEELLRDYQVYIALPDGHYVQDMKEMGCHFIHTDINRRGTNPIQDLKLLYQYIKIMKEIKPNMVLTYTIKPNVFGGIACQILNIPYAPNITGFGTAVEGGGLLHHITTLLYRLGLRKASQVYFQNQTNIDYAKAHRLVKGSYQLIPGSGVNLDYYAYADYPDSTNSTHFIYISRIMKEKGIEEYLYAAEILKSRNPSLHFHLVGYKEDDYDDWINDLQKRGIIKFYGEQADVRPFLKQSHCIVLPTFYPEGMSNVILEAAATGRPAITTDRPGTQEIILANETGYLIQAQSTDSLLQAMEKFIALSPEEKEAMGRASRKQVEAKFNRQIIVNAYCDHIQKCLAERDPSILVSKKTERSLPNV